MRNEKDVELGPSEWRRLGEKSHSRYEPPIRWKALLFFIAVVTAWRLFAALLHRLLS